MPKVNTKIEFRMNRLGRWTIKAATWSYRLGFKLPHRLVIAITNRSWQMRFGDGEWRSIRLAPDGRVIG